MLKHVLALVLAAGATTCLAQPTITSLGGGVPIGVTNSLSGTYYIGGSGLSTASAARWTLTGSTLVGTEIGGTGGGGYISQDGRFQTGQWLNTGPQIFGNTAAGVTPPFTPNPTLIPSTSLPAATEFAARRFSVAGGTWQSLGGLPIVPSLIAYGSSSSGQTTGNFLSGNGISSNGRFVVGLGYVCTYNNAGTAVSANSFRWRPWIWDAQANGGSGAMTILLTPFRTSSNTALRRTGNAYAVSTDGTVVLGAQEHNVGGSPGDSANHAVWRLNNVTGEYELTLLAGGGVSSTPSSLAMNAAGTIIAGRATDGTNSFLGKWTWNPGTSTWDGPQNLGSNLTTQASWLPGSVTSCSIPPSLAGSVAMSEDGNTIVGSVSLQHLRQFHVGRLHLPHR